MAVTFHTRMRHNLDRYVALTKRPHPVMADWWVFSLATHCDGGVVIDKTDVVIVSDGAKNLAS
jgi:hypothetical protein